MKRLLLIPDAPGGGTPTAPATDMVDSMMAEMTAASSSPPTPAPDPSPAPTPPPEPAKPASVPAPAKPAAVTPPPAKPAVPAKPAAAVPQAEKPLDWKTAPTQFRAAFEKLKSEFDNKTREYEGQLSSTKQQMQALEQRKYLTPEQETKYAQLEHRQQQLESELYSRDFRESPDFKAKYQAKADKIFQTVQNELKGIQVVENDTARPATIADFQKIRALGDSQVEQRRSAKALFGDDADVVLALAREMKGVEDAANEEIEAKRNGFQTERQKQQERAQSEHQSGLKVFGSYDKLLVEKFPQYFSPIEGNDEFNKALDQGVQYVDTNSSAFSSKSPEEKAQTAAMMRRWASSWPANQVLIKQLNAQLAERDATIRKLQGSDPGAGGEAGAGGGGSGDSERGGADSMADEIAKLQAQG